METTSSGGQAWISRHDAHRIAISGMAGAKPWVTTVIYANSFTFTRDEQ